MSEFIFNFTAVFQIFCFIMTLYFLIIAFFGLIKKSDDSHKYDPEKSFAIVVAAHDEEIVIANIVESLKELDYPKQLYDILSEIDKILGVDIDAMGPILISPTDNKDCYSEDRVENMLSKEEVLKNAKHTAGDFISVPRVIND
jgi:aspartyl/glutamyl-tRNA(Asn/Gln) amidotransferase C subunit